MEKTLPRGLRNNNPLNIRWSKNEWLGKVKNNTDGAFEQFLTIEYGLRAAFLNIRTIIRRRAQQNLSTNIKQLVHVWAPESDHNNEMSYVITIAKKTGLQPNDIVNVKNKTFMCLLVYGMAWVEVGTALTMFNISSAYDLAFGATHPHELPQPENY